MLLRCFRRCCGPRLDAVLAAAGRRTCDYFAYPFVGYRGLAVELHLPAAVVQCLAAAAAAPAVEVQFHAA